MTPLRLTGAVLVCTAVLLAAVGLFGNLLGQEWSDVSLGTIWFNIHPPSLNGFQVLIERYLWAPIWLYFFFPILRMSAWLLFGIVGGALFVLGRPDEE